MNYINVNDAYNISKVLTEKGNIYGLSSSTTDSHLMKNSEWGAVAYLAQSSYGNNGTEPYINNINLNSGSNQRTDDIAGGTGVDSVYAVTGVTTGSISAGAAGSTIGNINSTTGNTANSGVYTWDQEDGQKSSSTLNMYGVFDMSGGVWERTAGYISNGNWNLNGYGSSFTKDKVSTKYATVYPRDASQDDSSKSYDTSTTEKSNQVYATLSTANYKTNKYIYGDAIRETSTSGTGSTSWNGDYSYFPALNGPFTVRGGYLWDGSDAGLFCFHRTNGNSNYNNGFRPVLVALRYTKIYKEIYLGREMFKDISAG